MIQGSATLAALFAAALLSANLFAAVLTVTNTADSGPGTLRAALAGAASGDRIEFGVTGTITLTNGELLVSKSVNILGPGPTNLTVNGNHASRVFHIASNILVTLSGVSIMNGAITNFVLPGAGAGIFNHHSSLIVSNCVLSGNSVSFGNGGAIYNDGSGANASLTIVSSTLTGNSAYLTGGAIQNNGSGGKAIVQLLNSTLVGNNASGGGGIHNSAGSGNASVEITNSTLNGNAGGGISNFADNGNGTATVHVANSTLSANEGVFASEINNFSPSGTATVHILNSTIKNPAYTSVAIVNGGILVIGSSVLDAGPRILFGISIRSYSGTVTSLGYNLSGDNGGGFLTGPGDQINTDPMLGPLQDNGGPTFTHALSGGSPAIDKGKNLSGAGTDQRGSTRTVDTSGIENAPGSDGTDVGALESDIITVVNTDNDGPGSLRQAILDTKARRGAYIITFAASAFGTISMTGGEFLITDSLYIRGPGATNLVINGNHAGRVFHIAPSNTVGIFGLTISNGISRGGFDTGVGGGILNDRGALTVGNCRVLGNMADFGGGGIANLAVGASEAATLTMFDSTVNGNFADQGAGIWNDADSGGSANLQIASSTLTGNQARLGGGILNSVFTGGRTIAQIVNSTLSGNSATENGGGIDNINAGGSSASLSIFYSTLTGNSARTGGSILNDGSGHGLATVIVGSTILNASLGGNFVNLSGTITSVGHNLSSDHCVGLSSDRGDLIDIDPLLGPLQDNGGPTFTHALPCGSPGIDASGPTYFQVPNFDQRGTGFQRVVGRRIDIGAFEQQQICDQPPVADATATVQVVISPDGTNASVILDGSRSSDPDGDLLQYIWYENGILLTSEVVATAVLPVGTHNVLLVVNDGLLSDTNAVTIEVITPAEAMERLITAVNLNASRPAPLDVILTSAIDSIQRGNPVSAVNQLLAFQSEVRALVSPQDSGLADTFIEAAQEIIRALNAGTTNPGRRPHVRVISLPGQSGGRVQMQFAAEPATRCVVEASTNLIDWQIIATVTAQMDGSVTVEDPEAKNFAQRFYRIFLP